MYNFIIVISFKCYRFDVFKHWIDEHYDAHMDDFKTPWDWKYHISSHRYEKIAFSDSSKEYISL